MPERPVAPALRLQAVSHLFGPAPLRHLAAVQAGALDRAALLAGHGHLLALQGIDLVLPGGGLTVLMGPSGSGKSTLLRCLNRLVSPTAGQVWCGDAVVTGLAPAALQAWRRRQVAMVFQRPTLLPHLTVLANVRFGLDLAGVPRAAADARARAWVQRVGLAGFEEAYPAALSGGMGQRVGLARALATDAPVLLMDEPFSALDPLQRTAMQDLLLGLHQELRKTVVFVTHALDEALRLADHLVVLRDGVLVQQGSAADILQRPADAWLRSVVQGADRGRWLGLAALAQPGPRLSLPDLPGSLGLAQAVRQLRAAGATAANVTGPQGQHLGGVTLSGLLDVLLGDAADAPAPG
ncbi:ATP-binding cassette domain-containing protein [Pseudaquabacterium pictum]|uniref:Proline/glycine betaine ABC transporter ATP-binding protein n=1 Tax=Pseudaquabacterium pictum TaxID=2315236 RepID=A0A480ASD7_9BURK|nr:ATP-binding cassette domain-containing protein [Rubrivivax pictus]GCL61678.1 proline/glycine betaine ABC transporter ATP-binding protein [Rubrivivax pictus]